MESNFNGTVQIKNRNVIKDGNGSWSRWVARWRSRSWTTSRARNSPHQKISYGARLLVDDGDTVQRGTRLAQWDPYTRPILTEVDGVIDFEDLVEGASMREQIDEVKGTSNRVVIDWRASRAAPS